MSCKIKVNSKLLNSNMVSPRTANSRLAKFTRNTRFQEVAHLLRKAILRMQLREKNKIMKFDQENN